MQNIIEQINNFQGYIIIGLLVFVIIIFIMLISTLRSLGKLENKYRKFMRGVDTKNLEDLVISYLDNVDQVKQDTEHMKEMYKNIDTRIKNCVQKVAIVRYRAFEDVGSDLSFSIALLNESNDGVIITGIYGRHESTTYAKPVDRGISRYELSQEENQVLQECISKELKL